MTETDDLSEPAVAETNTPAEDIEDPATKKAGDEPAGEDDKSTKAPTEKDILVAASAAGKDVKKAKASAKDLRATPMHIQQPGEGNKTES